MGKPIAIGSALVIVIVLAILGIMVLAQSEDPTISQDGVSAGGGERISDDGSIILTDVIGLAAVGHSLGIGNLDLFAGLVLPGGISSPIITDPVTSVGTSTATLNGTLVDMGIETSIAVSFEYGTQSGSYPYSVVAAESPMSGTGPFHADIFGLISDTTYYFRAKGEGAGIDYGAEKSFTTLKTEVSTLAATNVGTSSATLNGSLDYLGTGTAAVSSEYGTQSGSYPYSAAAAESPMSGTGPFHADISGLIPGTTYYYRAKGEGGGTGYGAELTFTNLQAPVVTTNAASNINCNGATLKGYLDTVGVPASTDVWFEYGTTDGGPYDQTTTRQSMSSTGTFNTTVPLCDEVTYYFKAIADNGVGMDYGDQQSLTTTDCTTINTYEVASTGHMDGYGVDDWSDLTGYNPPNFSQNGTPNATELANVQDSDDSYYDATYLSGFGDEAVHWFQFDTGENPASVTNLEVYWEGYSNCPTNDTTELYIWSYTDSNWGDGAGSEGNDNYLDISAGGAEETIGGSITNITEYMNDSGQVSLITLTNDHWAKTYSDYVYVEVTSGGGSPPTTYELTTAVTGEGQIDLPTTSPAYYCGGTVMLQTSSTGGTFINWSGDVSTVADVNLPNTTIYMSGNYSVTANYLDGVTVDIYIDLQGDNRPPEGWEVPVSVNLFNPGSDVMTDIPLYSFSGTTSINTDSGTKAYFQCPDPVNPGTYDITTDTTTTLLNVKRNVGIW